MFNVMLRELVDFRNCYDLFGGPVPVKVAFTFEKIKAALEKELPFYQSKIKEIVDDCAEFDEDGKLKPTDDGTGFILKEDKVSDFYSRVGELESILVDIPTNKFKLDDFNDVGIQVGMMKFLMPFIEE